LLSSDNAPVQELAIQSIGNLAKSPQVRYTILNSDGVSPIFNILAGNSPNLQLRALNALTLISLQPELGNVLFLRVT
jgi:hypothetical protein